MQVLLVAFCKGLHIVNLLIIWKDNIAYCRERVSNCSAIIDIIIVCFIDNYPIIAVCFRFLWDNWNWIVQ